MKSGYDGPADQRAPVTNDGERPRQYDGPRQYDKKKPEDSNPDSGGRNRSR